MGWPGRIGVVYKSAGRSFILSRFCVPYNSDVLVKTIVTVMEMKEAVFFDS